MSDRDKLPIEIAFLVLYGIDRAILRRAAASAEDTDVSADRALLAEGAMSAQHFYELLAHHLGVAYMHKPLPISGDQHLDNAMRVEMVRLSPNPQGLDYVLAPRGAGLALVLGRLAQGRWRDHERMAITSPQRLAALIRLHHRRAIVTAASHGLPDWNETLSARAGWSRHQRLSASILGCAMMVGAWFWPEATLAALCLLFSLLFLAMVYVRLHATMWSFGTISDPQPRRTDSSLPIYTIVVPLYREARVVPDLVAALRRLDYPAARLDIKMVVETSDRDTIDALQTEHLPDRFEILIAPAGVPQTKPRALNVALQFTRGSFLVVYDAEDRPQPDQLRKAVDRFERSGDDLACVQARLAIDNSADSWITRVFTLEYAALFDVINPGLARLGLPIALGGTSNHFRVNALRRVNGWDAWNVTEDIDLGIRLARFGYRVDVLQSSTLEEAPYRLKAWLGQRCRWQKGWMVTLQTHSRNPARLFADLGLAGGSAIFAILCGTIASSLLGPVFVAGVLLQATFGPLLSPHTSADWAWTFLSALLIVSGIASVVLPIAVGIRRRRLFDTAIYVAMLPPYLLLLSYATWQALFEMMGRPHVWTKTEHGLAKNRVRPT
ncbi:glycosyltransferase family 2 protein [Lichenihabitans psoromatis]|uniref:glycosyltransferase family 2 protein n=1 Tax=Lichenihabitans psoromatis TaxID=2528642 RepID=UPI0013F162DB|nr:glycosyltransferase family 2 protein [Lichenihabitans psoromatis]